MWAKWLIWSFFFIHKTAVLPMPQEWKECKHRWRKTATTARGKKKEEKKIPPSCCSRLRLRLSMERRENTKDLWKQHVTETTTPWTHSRRDTVYNSTLTRSESSIIHRWDVRRHEPLFSGRTGWKEDKKWQGQTPDNIHSFIHNMIWTSPMRHTYTHTLTCTSCNNWSIAVICLLSGNFFREESQVCVCV